jgi:hypothetical protein
MDITVSPPPLRLCGVRFSADTMSELVTEAARLSIQRGRSVSVAAVVREAVRVHLRPGKPASPRTR